MHIRDGLANGYLVLTLEGRLDSNTSTTFQERLLAEVEQRPRSVIIVDLGPLNYLSSAGLRVLLLASRAAQRLASELRLTLPRPHVEEVMTIAGFDALFRFFPTAEEAARA